MKCSQILLFMLLLMFALSRSVFAATTDSTSMGPTAVSPKIQCTGFSFNNMTQGAAPIWTQSTLGASSCVAGTGGGLGFAAGMTGGGNLNASCPAEYPILSYIEERWTLVLGAGAAWGTPICCQASPNRVQTTTSWQNPSWSGTCN